VSSSGEDGGSFRNAKRQCLLYGGEEDTAENSAELTSTVWLQRLDRSGGLGVTSPPLGEGIAWLGSGLNLSEDKLMTWNLFLASEIIDQHVPEDYLGGWWLGGASWIFKHPHGSVLSIDLFLRPYGSPGWVRQVPPPFPPTKMPMGPLLVTHEHGDHCDLTVLSEMARRDQVVLLPPSAMAAWQRTGERAGPWRTVGPGRIETVGPWTISVFDSGDTTARSAVMYTISAEGVSIFHGGDTLWQDGLFAGIGEQLAPTYALLSVGRRDDVSQFYLSPQEATMAARELGVVRWIPMHWDMWSQNSIEQSTLEETLNQQARSGPGFRIPTHGQLGLFSPSGGDPWSEPAGRVSGPPHAGPGEGGLR